jgi:hypothetical protein
LLPRNGIQTQKKKKKEEEEEVVEEEEEGGKKEKNYWTKVCSITWKITRRRKKTLLSSS